MKQVFRALSHLIAPRVCRICGQTLTDNEEIMCLGCNLDMPRTAVHADTFNIIHQRLGHNAKLDRAAGWFYYKKSSPYAQMLIDAKYGSLPALARALGRMCAEELSAEDFFSGIDALVPMPMHWLKRLRRGYNQAYEISLGISEVTGLPILEALQAARSHGVQARHSRDARFSSISGTFQALPKRAKPGQHLLVVDDIITTGATAAEALRSIAGLNPAAVSILCLGLTMQQQ